MTVLLILSTVIATSGLLSDSAAVVIGAMLVAPMMNPVMAAASAAIMGWSRRFYASIWQVLAMGLGALMLSALITELSPKIMFLPEQVLARTRPTYYDLLIALAAGSAGAYTITRKEVSAIPGVAVAVALLPPLASAGILLTTGDYELAWRAVLLFLTNFVAMVLAGALTFIAVGVSPPEAHRQSAAFVKSKLWIFTLLSVAVCVPLWFYSKQVLFNARYKAARSEVLQTWLKDNELELIDIEFFPENETVLLQLAGLNPPVSIESLYQQISASKNEHELSDDFRLQYSWTQKMSGVWPPEGHSIASVVESDQVNLQALSAGDWTWQFTQYDASASSRPASGESYVLRLERNDKMRVIADCGSWKGKFHSRGKYIEIKLGKGLFSGCKKDPSFKVFSADLGRAAETFIDKDQLQIKLAGDSGIMYFARSK
jgi:uncharacterized hydrophobic protein (TIGR00271 family)